MLKKHAICKTWKSGGQIWGVHEFRCFLIDDVQNIQINSHLISHTSSEAYLGIWPKTQLVLFYPWNKQVCCSGTLVSTSACGHVINVMAHRWLQASKTPPCKFNRKDTRIPKKSCGKDTGILPKNHVALLWKVYIYIWPPALKTFFFLNFTKTPCREIQRRRSPNRTWTRQYIIAPEDCKFGGGGQPSNIAWAYVVNTVGCPPWNNPAKTCPLIMDGLENDGQSFFWGKRPTFCGGELLTFW